MRRPRCVPILNLNEGVPRTFHSARNLNAGVPRTCFENILPGSCTENIYMNGPLLPPPPPPPPAYCSFIANKSYSENQKFMQTYYHSTFTVLYNHIGPTCTCRCNWYMPLSIIFVFMHQALKLLCTIWLLNKTADTETDKHKWTHTHTHTFVLVIPPNRGQYDTQCIQSVYYMHSGTEHYDVQHAIGDALCMSMTVHW